MIERADPATRRTALIILLALCAPVLLMLRSTESQSVQVLAEQPELLLAVVVVVSLLMLVPLGLLWRLALRIQQSERFPPPGEKLLRDTRVRTGTDALRYARFLKVLVALLTLAITAIPVLFFLLLRSLSGG
ncbi:hypothetical protein [Litorivivens sp.]|uniref:hypothetical protein n=1 Tax=Litorivivens sp. TaxID=2020868 RepID=UPI0035633CDB